MKPTSNTSPNKTDAGNGSYSICRVINASRSPSPDPSRSPNFNTPTATMPDAEHTPEHEGHPEFRPGFRLSVFDFVFLGLGAFAAYYAFTLRSLPAAIPAYVIFTFFLYCNVFRIRRTPELIWAAAFTLTALASFYFQQPSWLVVFAGGIALTILLVAIEMRHPSYHGVFWRSVNPHLPTWWEQHHSKTL